MQICYSSHMYGFYYPLLWAFSWVLTLLTVLLKNFKNKTKRKNYIQSLRMYCERRNFWYSIFYTLKVDVLITLAIYLLRMNDTPNSLPTQTHEPRLSRSRSNVPNPSYLNFGSFHIYNRAHLLSVILRCRYDPLHTYKTLGFHTILLSIIS